MAKKKNKTLNSVLRVSINFLVNSIIILCLVEIFVFSYGFSYKVFANESYRPNATKIVAVKIEDGMSSMEITNMLEEKGLIENSYALFVRIKLSKYNGKLKPGLYDLCASMGSDEILSILSAEEDEDSNDS